MKAKLIASVVAAPLAFLSSLAFAAGPMSLNAQQMDSITAGQIGGQDPMQPPPGTGGQNGGGLPPGTGGGQTGGSPPPGSGIRSITITQENITILRGGNARPIVVSLRPR